MQISAASLQRLVGVGAYDSQGKGNINAGDGGIAFIVASAACVPGGADLVPFTESTSLSMPVAFWLCPPHCLVLPLMHP